MKKALTLATSLLTLTLLTPAHAQSAPGGKLGGDITQTYNLDTLTTRPGEILIQKNALTIIEMPDEIESIKSARPDLFDLTPPDGNQITLRALKDAGTTDLLVRIAGGATAVFRLKIQPSTTNTTRRYAVTFPEVPVQPQEALGPNPAPKPQQSASGEKVNNLVSSKTNNKNIQISKNPIAAPDWLPMQTTASFDQNNNTLAVFYNFTNNGQTAVVLDKAQLNVKNGNDHLNFLLSRKETIGARVTPNSYEYGTIVIPNAPRGKRLELTWNVTDTYSGARYQFTRYITVPDAVSPAAQTKDESTTPEGTNNEGQTPSTK